MTLLISGIVAEEKIALASNFLLKYMPVFFIPAGVTIITSLPLIQGRIPQFILVCLVTTFLVFLATSTTVIAVTRLQNISSRNARRKCRITQGVLYQGRFDPSSYDPSADKSRPGENRPCAPNVKRTVPTAEGE